MATYVVKIPITAYAVVEVEAENKSEAIEKASDSATLKDIEDWQIHEKIVRGNVFYGLLNEPEIEEIEDYE